MIDILKHRGRHIAVNMNAEKADLAPKDSAVRQFFVRVPENEKDKLFDIFGPEIDIVKAPEVQGEVAVVTDLISEKDFEEKLKKLDEVKGYLRLF